ncbi:MAG: hypothetical protein HZB14_07795 [Actinobacteria bacterium]|nr:hypothetical protein [Actinomycetota bacterium]
MALDDFLGGALNDLFVVGGNDKKSLKLMEEGELVPATIYAIKCRDVSDGGETWTWGLDLQTSSGPLRASVQQSIPGATNGFLKLGAQVKARHLNGRVAIDWAATAANNPSADLNPDAGNLPGKTLKKPLEPGIEDNRFNSKLLKNGTRAKAKVTGFEQFMMLGMPTQNWNIKLAVDDGPAPRQVLVKKALVPSYGAYLLAEGAELTVAVDANKPERVAIDWVATCEARE